MRREKSLRIGVHHADAVVWGPVCRTHLTACLAALETTAFLATPPSPTPSARRISTARRSRPHAVRDPLVLPALRALLDLDLEVFPLFGVVVVVFRRRRRRRRPRPPPRARPTPSPPRPRPEALARASRPGLPGARATASRPCRERDLLSSPSSARFVRRIFEVNSARACRDFVGTLSSGARSAAARRRERRRRRR